MSLFLYVMKVAVDCKTGDGLTRQKPDRNPAAES